METGIKHMIDILEELTIKSRDWSKTNVHDNHKNIPRTDSTSWLLFSA